MFSVEIHYENFLCKNLYKRFLYYCTLVTSVSKIVQGGTESRLIESIVGLAAGQWDRTNYDLKQILRLIAEQIQQTAKTNWIPVFDKYIVCTARQACNSCTRVENLWEQIYIYMQW